MFRIPLLMLSLVSLASGEWTNLWPQQAPGAKQPPAGSEKIGEGGRLSHIEIPQYQVYLPEKTKATGAAVVILPGGGYGILAANHEGHDIAKWFNKQGVAGIVVKYRVSGDASFGYQYPVPFLDARRAIRSVRANAAEWGIDPKQIGIMGFSAGGHLASLCTTRFGDTFPEETNDRIDQQNCRPDFSILIYPVISMDGALAHGGSRKNLLGANPTAELAEKCSTDRAVTPQTPPVFLLSTADDMVDCRNSLAFATACKANGVPVSLHLFESGGHGYGLNGKGDLKQWPSLLEQWLASRFPKP
jgi:acetyl esterase/lipase